MMRLSALHRILVASLMLTGKLLSEQTEESGGHRSICVCNCSTMLASMLGIRQQLGNRDADPVHASVLGSTNTDR